MPHSNELELYRVYAAKCFDLACETENSESRLALLEMAKAWRILADQADKTGQERHNTCH
jgi:hypothetical protein